MTEESASAEKPLAVQIRERYEDGSPWESVHNTTQLRQDIETLLRLLDRAGAMCEASGDTEVTRSKAYSNAYDLENADRCAQRAKTSYWLANQIRTDDGEHDL